MNTVAAMQPYFFPYLGYFKLISASNHFVILDDVDFRPRTWMTRNRIISNNDFFMFSLPVKRASQNRKISEIEIAIDQIWRSKFKKNLFHSYHQTPYFQQSFDLIESIIDFDATNLTDFLENSLRTTCSYLEIQSNFQRSSELDYDKKCFGVERILSLCELLKTDFYLNLPGGRHLYHANRFTCRDIKLGFIRQNSMPSDGIPNNVISDCSIIHSMMLSPPSEIRDSINSISIDFVN